MCEWPRSSNEQTAAQRTPRVSQVHVASRWRRQHPCHSVLPHAFLLFWKDTIRGTTRPHIYISDTLPSRYIQHMRNQQQQRNATHKERRGFW